MDRKHRAGWDEVKQELLNRFSQTANLLSYFESTWLNGNYDIDLWNCYGQTLSGLPRTNNASEGGNNSINVAFGCSKPSIWRCLDKIKEFRAQTDLVIVQYLVGQSNSVRARKKWINREMKIKDIVSQYDSNNNSSDYCRRYLRRLSYLLGH